MTTEFFQQVSYITPFYGMNLPDVPIEFHISPDVYSVGESISQRKTKYPVLTSRRKTSSPRPTSSRQASKHDPNEIQVFGRTIVAESSHKYVNRHFYQPDSFYDRFQGDPHSIKGLPIRSYKKGINDKERLSRFKKKSSDSLSMISETIESIKSSPNKRSPSWADSPMYDITPANRSRRRATSKKTYLAKFSKKYVS